MRFSRPATLPYKSFAKRSEGPRSASPLRRRSRFCRYFPSLTLGCFRRFGIGDLRNVVSPAISLDGVDRKAPCQQTFSAVPGADARKFWLAPGSLRKRLTRETIQRKASRGKLTSRTRPGSVVASIAQRRCNVRSSSIDLRPERRIKSKQLSNRICPLFSAPLACFTHLAEASRHSTAFQLTNSRHRPPVNKACDCSKTETTAVTQREAKAS